jgi:hypothetical protein
MSDSNANAFSVFNLIADAIPGRCPTLELANAFGVRERQAILAGALPEAGISKRIETFPK